MAYKTLRDNLVTLMTQLKGTTASDTFVEVKDVPGFEFDGYPSCFIAVSGNDSEFQSSQDNMRIYAYKIWVFNEWDSEDDYSDAYDALLDAADSVINKIEAQEKSDSEREIADNIGAGRTVAAVQAVPGRFASDEVEKLLAVEITVRVKVLVDITTLT